jgi:hypothetical protein
MPKDSGKERTASLLKQLTTEIGSARSGSAYEAEPEVDAGRIVRKVFSTLGKDAFQIPADVLSKIKPKDA